MSNFINQLKQMAERENLESIFVATSSGDLLFQVKGPQEAKYGRIQRMLFGGPEEISASYNGLESRILPQMYAQGDDRAVYSKLGTILYGIFYVGEMTVIEHWEKSKVLAKEFERLANQASELQSHINP